MDHFVTRSVVLLAVTITLTSLSISPVSARPFYEALRASRTGDDDNVGGMYAGFAQAPLRGNKGAGFDEAELLVVTLGGDGDLNSRPTGGSAGLSATEEIAFRTGYMAGVRDGNEGSSGDVTNRLRDWQLARLVSRSNGKRLRRSREVHPIYLGLAQEAASSAYDTITRIEQEDERRREEERLRQEGSNPVRFVG